MNAKSLLHCLVGAALAAALLWAADPWEQKPYTEWTEKDCEKVFRESPWSRQVSLRSGPVVTGASMNLTVEWVSAPTVQQAIARQRQLHGQMNEAEVARFLATPRPQYVIGVYGPGMGVSSIQKLTEEAVRESAYLEVPQSKQKIHPSSVRFVRQGNQVVAMELSFPRETEGKPVVGPGEKKVIFDCQLGEFFVSAEFDLRKMVRNGQPDL